MRFNLFPIIIFVFASILATSSFSLSRRRDHNDVLFNENDNKELRTSNSADENNNNSDSESSNKKKLVNETSNQDKLINNKQSQHRHHNLKHTRHHNHAHSSNSINSIVKSHKKRCHYSDNEFEALNNANVDSNARSSNGRIVNNEHADVGGASLQSYYISKKMNDFKHGQNAKQPKVREPHHGRHHQGSVNEDDGGGAINVESNVEKEMLLVNIGDTINLTCHINTREIDWHFKDKNLTTTVLSYGLQLQVAQPVLFDLVEDLSTKTGAGGNYDQYDEFEAPHENGRTQRNTAFAHTNHLFKYRVSSDRELTHVLSLYVQGAQDEGSYQCIDSKSETPIKKTIYVYLSKFLDL